MKPKNWITYLAGGLSAGYGILGAVLNLHSPDKMVDYIIAGLTVIGFRRAISKGQKSG